MKEGRKGKKVIPSHHSAGCSCSVAERFIDHLRVHSVRGGGSSMKERQKNGTK